VPSLFSSQILFSLVSFQAADYKPDRLRPSLGDVMGRKGFGFVAWPNKKGWDAVSLRKYDPIFLRLVR
jgi:hypothetical protein